MTIKILSQDYNKLKSSVPTFTVKEDYTSFKIIEIREDYISTLELNNIQYEELSRINS